MPNLLIKDEVLEGADWSYPKGIVVITVATLTGEWKGLDPHPSSVVLGGNLFTFEKIKNLIDE
jgi:hypothetical protein